MRLCGIIIALVSGMVAQFSYCAAAPRLEIKLASSAQWILGEPVIVNEAWQCLGDAPLTVVPLTSRNSRFAQVRIVGPVRNDCQAERRFVEEGAIIGKFAPMKASQVERGQINLRDWGVVDCGHYEVWVEYDATSARKDFYEAGLSSFKAESNRLQFDIVPPKGIDAEVMSQHSTLCHQVTLTQEELLRRFPTSTYAGYALLHGGPWEIDPMSEVELRGKSLATAEKWPDTRPQMEREEREHRDLNQTRADQLSAYLKARPDFVYADFMKLELATRYAYLERYQEAQCICEELLKKAPESKEGQKAQRFLAYLQDKGWVKK